MKRFLSFDCGYKPLAYSVITIDTGICAHLSHLDAKIVPLADQLRHAYACADDSRNGRQDSTQNGTQNGNGNDAIIQALSAVAEFLLELRGALMSLVTIEQCVAADIITGAVDDLDFYGRAVILDAYLQDHESSWDMDLWREIGVETEILIEIQPPKIGLKTNTITLPMSAQLAMWFATRGFTVHMVNSSLKCSVDVAPLTFAQAVAESNSKYDARKKHSRANFVHLTKLFGCSGAACKIKSANLTDVADSAMQAIVRAIHMPI